MKKIRNAPSWATHAGVFCGLVPAWIADLDDEAPMIQGRGWFADRCLLPVVTSAFQFFATICDWDFPIRVTHEVEP